MLALMADDAGARRVGDERCKDDESSLAESARSLEQRGRRG